MSFESNYGAPKDDGWSEKTDEKSNFVVPCLEGEQEQERCSCGVAGYYCYMTVDVVVAGVHYCFLQYRSQLENHCLNSLFFSDQRHAWG